MNAPPRSRLVLHQTNTNKQEGIVCKLNADKSMTFHPFVDAVEDVCRRTTAAGKR